MVYMRNLRKIAYSAVICFFSAGASDAEINIKYSTKPTPTPRPIADLEYVESFMLGARSEECGVDFIGEADYQYICVQKGQNCGKVAAAWTQISEARSGKYCPGAFHSPGWIEALCRPPNALIGSNEVGTGGLAPECAFQKKRQIVATCGIRQYKINAFCQSLQFGIDDQRLDQELIQSTSKKKMLTQILDAYRSKSYLINPANRRLLTRAMRITYPNRNVENFAPVSQKFIAYMSQLTVPPSVTEFQSTLIECGYSLN